MLMDYINLSIQDLYNEDNSTWRHIEETITTYTTEWDYNIFKTQLPIYKIQKCYNVVYWHSITQENVNLQPTLFHIDSYDKIKFSWNEIITHKDIKSINVIYLNDYVMASLEDESKTLPLPDRYVPALLKLTYDWASPINLMSWETSAVDFYSHWITRLNKLWINDSLSDYWDVNPAY